MADAATRIFFSYARSDSEFVLKVATGLRKDGRSVWVDQLDIPKGARWDDEVEKALKASTCLLAVLSPPSSISQNVLDEVSYALDEKKTVIPILVQKCVVPFRLKRLQYVDFTADYDDAYRQLGAALDAQAPPRLAEQVEQTSPAPRPGPVSLPAQVPSHLVMGLAIAATVVVGVGYLGLTGRTSSPSGDDRPPAASPSAPKGEIAVSSRSQDKLDVFAVDRAGQVRFAAWERSFPGGWRGWRPIGTARFPAGAPVSSVSRSADKLDIFATDIRGVVRTAAWQPAFTDDWDGWREIEGGRAAPGAAVTSVSRSADKIDVFVVGTDGHVYTAAWDPTGSPNWRWSVIGDAMMPAGAPIHVVSRSANKLDVFITDVGGVVRTAAWEPAFTDGWHRWPEIAGGRAAPGAAVTAVSRGSDKLDIFVVGIDGLVWTAAWDPMVSANWGGWKPIGNIHFPAGATIHAVSRSPDKLDIFGTDVDGVVRTAAWQAGTYPWTDGWLEIRGTHAKPGAPVSAVSLGPDKLDAFVVGTDGGTWTAAREPSSASKWNRWTEVK